MKILINTPSIKESRGGVANHYKGLKNFWKQEVSYNIIGDRNKIPGIAIFPFDLLKFTAKCLISRPDLIVLNPSLAKNAIKRDVIFNKIAKFLNIKTVLFFHGWDKNTEETINSNPKPFTKKITSADGFLVLASDFKNKLKEWGISKPIYLTTTKVDDLLLEGFELKNRQNSQEILFLARVEANKGIFLSLDVFKKIKEKFPNSSLLVAGNGTALEEAKQKARIENIEGITFTGKISGDRLKKAFASAAIYLLPTFHGEGMPTSILEAMSFGIPIITRPVGGVVDFFEEGKMGFLVESLNAADFYDKAEMLLSDNQLQNDISLFNYDYSKNHFRASKVAFELEKIFYQVLIK